MVDIELRYSEYRAIFEIMCEYMVQPDRPQMAIPIRMCIACCIIKAADTDLEFVILMAFPRQSWLFECALILRLLRTYITCLVILTANHTDLVFMSHGLCVCVVEMQ